MIELVSFAATLVLAAVIVFLLLERDKLAAEHDRERKRLISALLARNPTEFAALQREPREPRDETETIPPPEGL